MSQRSTCSGTVALDVPGRRGRAHNKSVRCRLEGDCGNAESWRQLLRCGLRWLRRSATFPRLRHRQDLHPGLWGLKPLRSWHLPGVDGKMLRELAAEPEMESMAVLVLNQPSPVLGSSLSLSLCLSLRLEILVLVTSHPAPHYYVCR